MMNEAQVSLSGYVATQPVTRSVPSGATNVSMRVAWTPRKQDRVTGEWTDGNTSYVTVICWRKLGSNVAVCVRKGDPVVVKGKLSVRTYEDRQGTRRTVVEVDASAVGHDLGRGVASFQRVRPQTGMTASEFAAAQDSDGAAGEPGLRPALAGPAPLRALESADGAYGAYGADGAEGAEHAGAGWADAGDGIPLPDEPSDEDEEFLDAAMAGDPAGAAEPAAVS